MPELVERIVLEKLVETLEQMTFAIVGPAESAPAEAPAEPLLASIEFRAPVSGRIEIVADKDLGSLLAANALGVEPNDNEACNGACDAIRELLNVTCGATLSHWPDADARGCEMSLPQVMGLSSEQWAAAIRQEGLTLLDAEGHTLAVRLILKTDCVCA